MIYLIYSIMGRPSIDNPAEARYSRTITFETTGVFPFLGESKNVLKLTNVGCSMPMYFTNKYILFPGDLVVTEDADAADEDDEEDAEDEDEEVGRE